MQLSAVMNSVAMNIHIWVIVRVCIWVLNSSGYIPRSGIIRSYSNPMFNLLRNCQTSGWTILHPHPQRELPSLLFFPPHTGFLGTSLFLPACLVTFFLGAPWCRHQLSDGAEGSVEFPTTGVELEWHVATTPCLSFLAVPSYLLY